MFRTLHNDPMPYFWGDLHAIASWRGVSSTGIPQAELWLGTHAVSPSVIEGDEGAWVPLSTWLAERGVDSSLPFLVKVLAASSPLSIQVHPTKEEALVGFRDEDSRGISIGDPTRNYKDTSDKPELLIAWSESFDALVGFVTIERANRVADVFSRMLPSTDLSPLRNALEGGITHFVEWIFAHQSEVARIASDLFSAYDTGGRSVDSELDTIWSHVVPHYPKDPGIVAASFMNLVSLESGQALFVPAGVPHAYLQGFGLEVMAPSDNVLRAGLTPKHVDALELLRIVRKEPYDRAVLSPENNGSWARWSPLDAPFRVSRFEGAGFLEEAVFSGPVVAVVERGEVHVSSQSADALLSGGSAYAAVLNGEPLTVTGTGRVFFISGV